MYNWRGLLDDFKYYMSMEKNLSINTVSAYLTDNARFVDFIEQSYKDLEPKKIELTHINKFIESISIFKGRNKEEKLLKATSQTRIIQSLRAFFKYMVITDTIDKDISKLIITPKQEQKLPVVLDNEEIMQIINSIDVSDFKGFRNRLTVEFLYATGLRVSEFVNLKLENIKFKEEYLDIIGKGNKERFVPIATKVVKDLEIYITQYRNNISINPKSRDYVFVSQKQGKKLTRQFINKMLNEVTLQTGINKKIHPHTLRHSFATELIRSGANLMAVKEMMGHATIRSTEVYINLKTQDLQETLQKYHPFYQDKIKD